MQNTPKGVKRRSFKPSRSLLQCTTNALAGHPCRHCFATMPFLLGELFSWSRKIY
jgi:hypothetical protein